MKMLLRLSFVFLLACVALAQSPTAVEEPPELVIVKFSWEKRPPLDDRLTAPTDVSVADPRRRQDSYENVVTNPRSDSRANDRFERARRDDSEEVVVAERKEQYAYKVTLENKAAKAIKAIYWDYVFFDPETDAEADRHQFYHKEKIGAGKKRELLSLVPSPPTRVINVNEIGKKTEQKYKEKIIINRIEYADNTVWQRSSFTVPDDRDR